MESLGVLACKTKNRNQQQKWGEDIKSILKAIRAAMGKVLLIEEEEEFILIRVYFPYQ